MDKRYSSQLLDEPSRAEVQPIELSQKKIQESPRAKDYTSNMIGWVLQGGVMLSVGIILIGLLMLLVHPNGLAVSSVLTFPQTFGQVWIGLLAFNPLSIIMLGLILLIVTPILRVVVSIVAFALDRDFHFVVITVFVLSILILSNFLLGNFVGDTVHTSAQTFHISLLVILLILVGSVAAGTLGSLVGLGGGVLIVPILTLVFGLPIYFAIGASIISVIATSSGAAGAYVRDHLTNLRVGMFLEIATTLGAVSGAFLAGLLVPNLLFLIFGVVLLISAVPLIFKIGEELPQGVKNDRWANWLHLSSSYHDDQLGREVPYQVTQTPVGLAMMYVAGALSGLLGIGSGSFKVIAMDTTIRRLYL